MKWIWQAFILMGLLVAILNHPLELDLSYGYFVFLRFAVFAAFVFWSAEAHKAKKAGWRNAFALVALFYNPFLPIELGDWVLWLIANCIASCLTIATYWVLFFESKQRFKKYLLASVKSPWIAFKWVANESTTAAFVCASMLILFLALGGIRLFEMTPIGKERKERMDLARDTRKREFLTEELKKIEWSEYGYTVDDSPISQTRKLDTETIEYLTSNLSSAEIDMTLKRLKDASIDPFRKGMIASDLERWARELGYRKY